MRYIVVPFKDRLSGIMFKNIAERKGIKGNLGPTPRSLSVSCGVCVRISLEGHDEAGKKQIMSKVQKIISENPKWNIQGVYTMVL